MTKILQACAFLTLSLTAQAQLKIQTLNFNSEAKNSQLADARYPLMREYIRTKDIDVFFFQEDWDYKKAPNISMKIAEDLGYDSFYHLEDGLTGVFQNSNAIILKKNLHFRDSTFVYLPHSAFHLGDGIHRIVSFGNATVLIGGTIDLPNASKATIWTTHLTGYSHPQRMDQVRFMLEFIKGYMAKHGLDFDSTPIILGGDMNSDALDPEGELIRSAGFSEAWMIAHPNDAGITVMNDPLDPQYNPMVHSAGQFPAQYDDQGTGRIDAFYLKNLSNAGIGAERIFTQPLGRIWMSDHFSLMMQLDFSGGVPNLPSADSDVNTIGVSAVLTVDDSLLQSQAETLDIDVPSLRGFSLLNKLKNTEVDFAILNKTSQVYNTNHASLFKKDDIASFTFFSPGEFKYRLRVGDPLADPSDRKIITGILHVH